MAINTVDQMYAAISAGQNFKFAWNKQTGATTAYTAGRWYALETLAGSPAAETYGSLSASTAYALNSSNVGWMPTGGTAGSVSPSIKNLVGIEAITTSSTGVPSWLLLVDMLMVYPSIPLTSATTVSLTQGAVTLPRYTNGQGVMMFLELFTSTGFTGTLSVSYQNAAASPVTKSTPGTIQCNSFSAYVPVLLHSGTNANNFAPFLPLAAGDTGVTSANSVTIGTSGAGTANLILCKPLAQIPLTTQYVPSGRDLVFNMPSAPVIQENGGAGAYLNFLLFAGAATAVNSQFNANLDYVWG